MASKSRSSLDSSSNVTAKQISEKRHSDDQQVSQNAHNLVGGWSFLQSLSSADTQNPKKSANNEEVYVHPLVKRSKLTLTKKSLELCTENLGNETGSDFIESSVFDVSVTSSSSEKKDTTSTLNSQTREHNEVTKMKTSSQRLGVKKMISQNFPPPLTTIRGSECLGVRTHREDGRLIIEAVKVEPANQSYLQAERSLGRLTLYVVKGCSTDNFDSEKETDGEFESEEEVHEDENVKKLASDDQLIDVDHENGDLENYERKRGHKMSFEHEMGMEKFERPCRCEEGHENENNNGLMLNWDQTFWVAT